MNKVILIGRLSNNPELRYSQGGNPIAVIRFGIAVNRGYKRENEPDVDFLNCICFGNRAETIDKYFRKGNRIAITGRIQTGSYTDQSGNKRYTTDIVVEEFEFVENKSESKSDPIPEPSEGFYEMGEVDDEDLPF